VAQRLLRLVACDTQHATRQRSLLRQSVAMVARVVLAFGAASLFFSTFLNWFPAGIEGAYLNRSVGVPAFSGTVAVFGTANAWQAFSVIDVLLAALVVTGAAAALVWRAAILAVVACAATILGGVVLYRAFEPPSQFFGWIGPGMVVGFGALIVIALAATAGALDARTRP
jgi:hypothetical protein